MDVSKATAGNALQNNYKYSMYKWDKTKAELDIETKLAIIDIQITHDETSQIANDYKQISKDISKSKTTINKLDDIIDKVIQKATKDATTAILNVSNTTVSKYVYELQDSSGKHL